jgi:hypothetical protein
VTLLLPERYPPGFIRRLLPSLELLDCAKDEYIRHVCERKLNFHFRTFLEVFAGVSGFERFVRQIALTLLKYIVVLSVFVVSSVTDTMREEGEGAEGVCVSCGVYDNAGGIATLSFAQREQFSTCASSGTARLIFCFAVDVFPSTRSHFHLLYLFPTNKQTLY